MKVLLDRSGRSFIRGISGNAAGRSVDIVNKVRTCSNLTNLVTSFNYLRVFRAVVNILENSPSILIV